LCGDGVRLLGKEEVVPTASAATAAPTGVVVVHGAASAIEQVNLLLPAAEATPDAALQHAAADDAALFAEASEIDDVLSADSQVLAATPQPSAAPAALPPAPAAGRGVDQVQQQVQAVASGPSVQVAGQMQAAVRMQAAQRGRHGRRIARRRRISAMSEEQRFEWAIALSMAEEARAAEAALQVQRCAARQAEDAATKCQLASAEGSTKLQAAARGMLSRRLYASRCASDAHRSTAPQQSPRPSLSRTWSEQPKGVSAAELLDALGDGTSSTNFMERRICGQGGFGTVYFLSEGELPSVAHRGPCAIKRQKVDILETAALENEVALLSLCRHDALLPLIAYCFEPVCRCLVYPYMPGGNLEESIVREDGAAELDDAPLSAGVRLRILLDVCRALLYLHTPHGPKGVVYHHDIKPANILLDASRTSAKLTDLGLALHKPPSGPTAELPLHVSGTLKGTIGFLDPIYMRDGVFTEHTDNYAMGISILVVLTGRSARVALDAHWPKLKAAVTALDVSDHASNGPWPMSAASMRASYAALRAPVDASAAWSDDCIDCLEELIGGLIDGDRREERMSLVRAVKTLEKLTPGEQTTEADAEELSECKVCMVAPRSVRFTCGHLCCCAECAVNLIALQNVQASAAGCPLCRSYVRVRMHNVVPSAPSFLAPRIGASPPMSPAARTPPPALVLASGEELSVTFLTDDIGLLGIMIKEHTYPQHGGRTICEIISVMPGSLAATRGVLVGAEIVSVNGRVLTRQQILSVCHERPLTFLMRGVVEPPMPTATSPTEIFPFPAFANSARRPRRRGAARIHPGV